MLERTTRDGDCEMGLQKGKRCACSVGGGAVRTALVLGTALATVLMLSPAAFAGVGIRDVAKTAVTIPVDRDGGEERLRASQPPADGGGPLILVQASGAFAVDDIVGEAGAPIDIAITLPPFQPTDYLLLSFRGLPKGFSLSSGFRTADAWLVSAHDARDLQLVPPNGFIGGFTMEVQFIRGQNVVPLVQSVNVDVQGKPVATRNVSSQETTSTTIAAVVPPEPRHDTAPPPAVQVSPEKEKQLMGLAGSILQQKDIAAARLIYARLAREGSVQGALTLAQTYDPAFLSRYDTTGLQPDTEKAKYWYGIAASMGSEDASGRLLALESATR